MRQTRAAGARRGRRWLVVAAAVLATGCGSPSEEVDAIAPGPPATEVAQDVASPEPTGDLATSSCQGAFDAALPAPPAPVGPVGAPAEEGYEAIGESLQTVLAGESATVDLAFEGASAALLWILPGDEGISASLDGAEFAQEDLLGVATLVGSVTSPADGPMVLRNETGQTEDIAVLVFGLTGRRLVIEASPNITTPNEEVGIVIRLSEARPTDQPCASVSTDGVAIAALALQPDGLGVWRSSFRPDSVGHYTFAALVGGERPRRSSLAFVEVQ